MSVTSVADGLQLQWLQDRTVDMAATVDAVFALLDARGPQSSGRETP